MKLSILTMGLLLSLASVAYASEERVIEDAGIPTTCEGGAFPNINSGMRKEDGSMLFLRSDDKGRLYLPRMFDGWSYDKEKMALVWGESIIHLDIVCMYE